MDYSDDIFQPCREWIATCVDNGMSWEAVKNLGVDADKATTRLKEMKMEEAFPLDLTIDEWILFVEDYRNNLIAVESVNEEDVIAIDKGGLSNTYEAPVGFSSSWEKYKNSLKTKMSGESIANLQKSCLWILNHLCEDTRSYGEVKGLVMGSVQSGKTANMEGLISMAADYDWNFFIILSGTIDNLRKQTRDRFISDLCNSEGILWRVIDFSGDDKKFTEDELKLNALNESKNFANRYLTVCLKNKKRLEKLIDWLYSDPKRTNKLRIVVIDDEADQASINTAEITDEEVQERCAINQMIVNLVNGRKSDGSIPNAKFQAMNYISYTATPYANVLNEAPGESLYPSNFICTLPEAHEYFGAKVIFGNEENDENCPGFPVIRSIPTKDEAELKNLHKGEHQELPESFQRSVAWFLCSAALLRHRNYRKPISMLIHTTATQKYHFEVNRRVKKWLKKEDRVFNLCKKVYKEECGSVTIDDLKLANPEYGFIDSVDDSYPKFETILPEIKDLVSDIRNIELGEDKELEYGMGIHLCVDNCRANKEAEEGTYLRIVYPDDKKLAHMEKAPVFIVIGGNTLSRGLTIEGLSCSYFARTSNLADTLMQMARWFGYRKGYELLQRIWMTNSALERFKALTKVDMDLKREVKRFMDQGVSPSEFGPRIRNIPEIAKFRITSKKKSQLAVYDDFDFCGDSYETTDFEDGAVLKSNLKTAQSFIEMLNLFVDCRRSDSAKAWVWDSIDYKTIKKEFLSRYIISRHSSLFNNLPYFGQWMESMNEDGKFLKWNVAVVDGDNREQLWKISDTASAGCIERSKKKDTEWIDIGSLRSGLDALCDVDKEQLSEDQQNTFTEVCKTRKDIISERSKLNLEDIPLLLIYRIKKDGGEPKKKSIKHRVKMDSKHDIIGISIIVSGNSIGESHAKTLRIKM